MAYVQKTGKSYVVKKGNSGEVIHRFSGKNAKERAEAKMLELHKKHKPQKKNRGKVAQKREEK